MSAPGPITRASSRRDARRDSAKPYVKRSGSRRSAATDPEGGESSGLTKYVGDVNLGFGEDEAMEDEDAVPEMKPMPKKKGGVAMSMAPSGKSKAAAAEPMDDGQDDGEIKGRTVSTFGRAFSSFRTGKTAKPKEIDIWKPNQDDVLGLTFEVPEDEKLKGVVVANIAPGGLIARSKKLKVGDVLHAVNGMPVTTPQQGATLLRDAKGVLLILATRAGAKPRRQDGDDDGELSRGDKTKSSFMPSMLSFRPGKGKKEKPAEPAQQPNTTVVVSCSNLILESKKIVGPAAGLDEKLDAMYAKLKAKEVSSQATLQQLIAMVGQTVVEQAGLVIANLQTGTLPPGWVEYFDKASGRPYFYNVHTKTTTWYKPRKEKPPAPPGAPGGRATAPVPEDDEDVVEVSNSTSTGHNVSNVIAHMQTKKKMVETVQIECSAPRDGPRGLKSVSL